MKINKSTTQETKLYQTYSNNDVFTGGEPTSYCHLNTLCQFCSFILMKQLTTVSTFTCLCCPSCPSLLQSTEFDHGWERGIEAIIAWVHREDEEDHDDTPEPHNLEQEQENTCGTIWLLLCLLQTLMCCSPWAPLPVKHLHRVKHFTSHVVSIPFLLN